MLRKKSFPALVLLGSLVPIACSDESNPEPESSPAIGDDEAPEIADGGATSDDEPPTATPGDGGTSLGGSSGACAVDEFMFDDGCREASICSPGEFVLTDARATADRVCGACPEGTFSDVDNAAACAEWSDPSLCLREEWSTPGTALRDIECDAIRHLVSHDGEGMPLPDLSSAPTISSDGSTVVFVSRAEELVDGSPEHAQIYAYDVATGTASAITRSYDGELANGLSWDPAISGDGRFACFSSDADNLVLGDSNGATDVFLHDIERGETVRIGLTEDGSDPDGRTVECSLSSDGRYVAFTSGADNLRGGVRSTWSQVYVFDRETNLLQLMSRSPMGRPANRPVFTPKISGDGEFVAFQGEATNLVVEDTTNDLDVFLASRSEGDLELISVDSDGVSHTGTNSLPVDVSYHGEVVVFASTSSNYVPGDSNNGFDIFARDRRVGTTTLVSQATTGEAGNDASRQASLSSDGRYVVFSSASSNLVDGDTEDQMDIFARDLQEGTTIRISQTATGEGGFYNSVDPQLSGDGQFVVFISLSANFHPFANRHAQVYLFSRAAM